MTENKHVQKHHLDRKAFLYVRQSSMKQVLENVESTKRQYALKARAIALGWPEERIVVIDSDQGESGASAAWREGFKQLVAEVSLGHAGIVMGLEVSRLARNNADWHRLLEICALADTLILDEDGVYDPSSFNDRLLLGLKGAMSEAELHVLKARLRGGVINAARRGEYRCPLPTGFEYDERGEVVLHADAQVRGAIAHLFEVFKRVGSAHQAVKVFRKEGVEFPSRGREGGGTIVFRPLTASTAIRTLRNPRYAGTYAYGRRKYRRTIEGKKIVSERDSAEWVACIPGAHVGYITWEQHLDNINMLRLNGRTYELARASPPREGGALLQGRAVCGRCGRHFRVRYASRRGRLESWYVCDRGSSDRAAPECQSIAGGRIDDAIGTLVVERMTPAAIDLTLEVQREIERRHEEADQLRRRAVDRAGIDADLAQRRFMLVDPANRLVADTLEADWNQKLRLLADARSEAERARAQQQLATDAALRERLVSMTSSFRKIWADPGTPNRERKRLLAHVIEDVTLVKNYDESTTTVHVRFAGGATHSCTVGNPKSPAELVKTQPEIVALVDRLLDDHIYEEIAAELNDRGFRPGGAVRPGRGHARFTANRVAYLAHKYNLRSRFDRLRARGLLTKLELAARLGIHPHTVRPWTEHGLVRAHAYNAHGWLYEDPGGSCPPKHSSRWNLLAQRAARAGAGAAPPVDVALAAEEVQCEAR